MTVNLGMQIVEDDDLVRVRAQGLYEARANETCTSCDQRRYDCHDVLHPSSD